MHDLETALASGDNSTVLAAGWNAFDLVEGVADSVTWEGGDELQALAAAQAASAGRGLLPLPGTGRPHDVLPTIPGADALVPYADLMRHVHAALTRLAQAAGISAETRTVLREAAGHAAAAAGALASVWER
ncbi:hypothetical protein [Streptomyces sp. NPDC000880]